MKFVASSELPYIPASHEDPRAPGSLKRVLLTKADFFPGQVQMVNWALLPSGKSFRRHYHEDMAEVFMMVQGEVTMSCGSETRRLGVGDLVLVSPGEEHEMRNDSEDPAEYIVFGVSRDQGGKTIVV